MKTTTTTRSMAKSGQDMSFKRQFQWTTKVNNEDDEDMVRNGVVVPPLKQLDAQTSFKTCLTTIEEDSKKVEELVAAELDADAARDGPLHMKECSDKQKSLNPSLHTRRKLQSVAVSRLRFILAALVKKRANIQQGQLGSRVVGTLFGQRKGHVSFAFQKDSSSPPALLVELATPITGLVREMASGLVRIALECDKDEEKKATKLIEEPIWRTYCNGKKSGFTMRREFGPKELKILKALENVSMGAGVLPGGDGDCDGDVMYMRANFERVVGSKDSEAFYMMNPDSNGAPELSMYLLRV